MRGIIKLLQGLVACLHYFFKEYDHVGHINALRVFLFVNKLCAQLLDHSVPLLVRYWLVQRPIPTKILILFIKHDIRKVLHPQNPICELHELLLVNNPVPIAVNLHKFLPRPLQ